MSAVMERLRNLGADALMLFVLPCAIAVLPWRSGFALLRRIARSERVYRLSVEPAWAAAHAHCPASDEREWKYRFRLLRLVDHADVYLTLLRGERWHRKNVVETGDWPRPGPCVFLTYHWGAGGWIWPRLRELGFDAHFLARRASGRALGLTRLSYRFAVFRAWALRRSGSAGPIFTGASTDEIASALKSGHSIVGMLDLPVRPDQRGADASLLGAPVRLPSGLARMALDHALPIALFSVGLDLSTGRRDLRIECLPSGLSVEQILYRYAAHLDARLQEQPAFWQLWREAPAIFTARADAESKTQGIQ